MNYYQIVFFSFSVFFGALVGWIKVRRIGLTFLPFIICLSIALLNEVISVVMTYKRQNTAYNNNVYVLIEGLLITWQFKNWGLFNKQKKLFYAIVSLLVIVWTIENFFFRGFNSITSYYRILCSLVIVLMSIHINNDLIMTFRRSLLRHPTFLICTGFIIYFTLKVLIETFWFYGFSASKDFRNNVFLIMIWINLFVNLLYALAILWIPRKPQFIKLF